MKEYEGNINMNKGRGGQRQIHVGQSSNKGIKEVSIKKAMLVGGGVCDEATIKSKNKTSSFTFPKARL